MFSRILKKICLINLCVLCSRTRIVYCCLLSQSFSLWSTKDTGVNALVSSKLVSSFSIHTINGLVITWAHFWFPIDGFLSRYFGNVNICVIWMKGIQVIAFCPHVQMFIGSRTWILSYFMNYSCWFFKLKIWMTGSHCCTSIVINIFVVIGIWCWKFL